MLGLILLYWIGKHYSTLAEEHNKSKWGFAILGIVSYYGGILVTSFTAGVFMEILSPGFVDTVNEFLFGIMMIPFGILTCFLLYKFLENKWDREQRERMFSTNLYME